MTTNDIVVVRIRKSSFWSCSRAVSSDARYGLFSDEVHGGVICAVKESPDSTFIAECMPSTADSARAKGTKNTECKDRCADEDWQGRLPEPSSEKQAGPEQKRMINKRNVRLMDKSDKKRSRSRIPAKPCWYRWVKKAIKIG